MFVCYTEVLCLHHMAGAASVISWAMSIHPFHRTVTVTPHEHIILGNTAAFHHYVACVSTS